MVRSSQPCKTYLLDRRYSKQSLVPSRAVQNIAFCVLLSFKTYSNFGGCVQNGTELVGAKPPQATFCSLLETQFVWPLAFSHVHFRLGWLGICVFDYGRRLLGCRYRLNRGSAPQSTSPTSTAKQCWEDKAQAQDCPAKTELQ